jgi:hypothetical protein
MFKFNKKLLLKIEHNKISPLLNYIGKGDKEKLRIGNIKERARIKKIKNISGMEITYDAIKKQN